MEENSGSFIITMIDITEALLFLFCHDNHKTNSANAEFMLQKNPPGLCAQIVSDWPAQLLAA